MVAQETFFGGPVVDLAHGPGGPLEAECNVPQRTPAKETPCRQAGASSENTGNH